MSDTLDVHGSCLCGVVKITAQASRSIGACHCNMCRRWGGGPLLAADCGSDVKLEGGDQVATFGSSDWAERGFCRRCGSHLFYRLKGSNQYIMPVGLFEKFEGGEFDHQVFIDEKPSYYCFSGNTRDMTGAEVFAQYGASPE